jgi:hypothetical protein
LAFLGYFSGLFFPRLFFTAFYFEGVFKRKPAPDSIRDGRRFASRKRLKKAISAPVWAVAPVGEASPPGTCLGIAGGFRIYASA